nr:putative disease resistance protein [Quercus suber]
MAEPVVSGALTRIGDLLIQESNFLYGDESDILRQWVAETRDLAYDAEDIIATYALKVASKKEGGVPKRCACILYEGITVHNIKAKISILKTSFQDYGIRESIIQGGGSGSLNERQ